MNCMLIRRFFLYSADFWAAFAISDECFGLLPQMGFEKTPITSAIFR